jgi:hypothetical protein
LITFKSFVKALLTGFQRDARRSRPPIADGLNGLRLQILIADRVPRSSASDGPKVPEN